MKLFLIASLFVLGSLAATQTEVITKWAEFKAKHNKVYRSALEDRKRFSIFQDNLKKIDEHNKLYKEGKVTFTKAINHFGDMTKEEFLAYVGTHPKPNKKAGTLYKPKNVAAAEVDWRNNGIVTEVKNQGQCGSCWSFSATGSLEGQYAKSSRDLISLSEQQLVDCSTDYGNGGCNGGNMDAAFSYIQDYGIESEQDYPYEAVDGNCRADDTKIVTRVTGYVDIAQDSETDLQNAVSNVGPISVAIDATDELQFYSSGYFVDDTCSPDLLNHGVLAVGYGSDNGQDYWIVKNSWSADWGEQGYVNFARNRNNMCGIASMASYPNV